MKKKKKKDPNILTVKLGDDKTPKIITIKLGDDKTPIIIGGKKIRKLTYE